MFKAGHFHLSYPFTFPIHKTQAIGIMLFAATAIWSACVETETGRKNNSGATGDDAGAPGESDTGEGDTGEGDTEEGDAGSECVDNDSDGWCEAFDCDDDDSSVNRDQTEVPGNGVDDDCDGQTDGMQDTDDETCDEQGFNIQLQPVRLMILQDMSSSMKEESPSKWEKTREAIQIMLANPANAEIEFGFDVFPGSGQCATNGPVQADCAPGNAAAISAMLDTMTPGGSAMTPMCPSMMNFDTAEFPNYATACMADGADRYLLIVSDGEANCGDASIQCGYRKSTYSTEPPTPAELATKTANILQNSDMKTFVIGYGNDVEEGQLNAIAAAGGTSFTDYIQADDQAQLQSALDSIAQTVVSCSYTLSSPDASADPSKVNFYFDSTLVPWNQGCAGGTGWQWTDLVNYTTVEFCADSCDQLSSGGVTNVKATFGCKSIVV